MKKIMLSLLLLTLILHSYAQFGRTESPYNFKMTQPVESTELAFSDSCIQIDFYVMHKYIAFELQNKFNKPIKIDWQNTSIIINGESKRIFHEGIKYINRNENQPPTTVPPNAKYRDLLMPTDNVTFTSGSYGGWKESPLFPVVGKKRIDQMNGKELGIYIPIVIEDKTYDYSFQFVITGFKPVPAYDRKDNLKGDDIYK